MNDTTRRTALSLGALATLVAAPTAQAADTMCATAGYLEESAVCIYDKPNGYQGVLYAGDDMREHRVEFALLCRRDDRVYGGTSYKVTTKVLDWTFAVPRQGYCSFQVKDLTRGKTWRTPSIHR
ncbi:MULTISPECIES: hypothetical protein [Streptomyces]|uniref:Secreted protein n=2 Tax=Streptomyces TaxID=1883 RepID=A0A100Y788_9ACTN|nr:MULTISPECIES: hypothetical protein [Streptomyces]KUH38982.1 hypothetical protein ATE80_09870 [Streptomyces kanasensis]UUS31584.1 hypothetical protein NRO40_12590 [Streptomyces changanensis]